MHTDSNDTYLNRNISRTIKKSNSKAKKKKKGRFQYSRNNFKLLGTKQLVCKHTGSSVYVSLCGFNTQWQIPTKEMCAMHPLRVVLSVISFSAFHRFLCILPKLFKPTPSQLGKEHIYVFAAIYPWQACWLHPFSITWNTLCLISLSVPQVSQDLCAWPICQCSIMGTLHWTVCWNGGQFDQHFQGHMQTERPPPRSPHL